MSSSYVLPLPLSSPPSRILHSHPPPSPPKSLRHYLGSDAPISSVTETAKKNRIEPSPPKPRRSCPDPPSRLCHPGQTNSQTSPKTISTLLSLSLLEEATQSLAVIPRRFALRDAGSPAQVLLHPFIILAKDQLAVAS
ncbi:hypothetical protein N658DRAFT_189002 [Parathielavia hyrcaniae]|uniref:Uncharacterized protein n=1 Tax=Parathielavia hyrcaniae TaxID=113614 RepID=A0AAN6QCM6_9PEZI|nr:hypothetical protein N658DRAFT_189002 [Parathielavia hyrcaniae]